MLVSGGFYTACSCHQIIGIQMFFQWPMTVWFFVKIHPNPWESSNVNENDLEKKNPMGWMLQSFWKTKMAAVMHKVFAALLSITPVISIRPEVSVPHFGWVFSGNIARINTTCLKAKPVSYCFWIVLPAFWLHPYARYFFSLKPSAK